MHAKLYVLPGSHPCAAVETALKLKRIAYSRVDLLPLVSIPFGRIAYGGTTVPGLRIDGERLVGSRTIMRRLDELVPEPSLLPYDADGRERALAAEQWGLEVLQGAARRIADALLIRRPRAMESYVGDAKLPLPTGMLRPSMPIVARVLARKNHADDTTVKADLAALPGWLDQIDEWVAVGTLGGEAPNAADLQIGASLRLLNSFGDVRPLLAGRPCARLIELFAPEPGAVEPDVLPADWLRAPAAAR